MLEEEWKVDGIKFKGLGEIETRRSSGLIGAKMPDAEVFSCRATYHRLMTYQPSSVGSPRRGAVD